MKLSLSKHKSHNYGTVQMVCWLSSVSAKLSAPVRILPTPIFFPVHYSIVHSLWANNHASLNAPCNSKIRQPMCMICYKNRHYFCLLRMPVNTWKEKIWILFRHIVVSKPHCYVVLPESCILCLQNRICKALLFFYLGCQQTLSLVNKWKKNNKIWILFTLST